MLPVGVAILEKTNRPYLAFFFFPFFLSLVAGGVSTFSKKKEHDFSIRSAELQQKKAEK